ncbi:NAD(P)/FAD-dependent oxidoreductase [Collimonas sp. OK412]|jgi:2-polyprenyl-6-methoxyphenol hydroxylase-like FAD-dependent oxidoreductase|uniref:FAD-dependent oxidoreductase n=1 Tax=Collimonas sp. (strain OK412) TaxID=1801619 RepID=UPI0008E03A02|nr:NAD(P)/FAD-dependent oxidoreductase [Collimonas sp. OK412]SFC04828.1 2-polyprenyl-6-methoxyphenol hydroxylase [Collimonas sp. OK412]
MLRIAIVGGGTAGAASALFLARAGHQVTLFERVAQPTAVGAGILLQPTGMHVLAALGLLDTILEHGARNDRLFGTTAGGRTVLDVRYRHHDPQSFGLGLHRGALFSVLWQAVQTAGIAVRSATDITRIQQSGGKTLLFSRDPAPGSVEAAAGEFDCAVIADGTRSQLRAALAIPQKVTPYPWGALWALVPDDGLTQGGLRQWFRHAHQMLGLMPTGFAYKQMERPILSLFWSLRADRLQHWQEQGLEAWKKSVLELAPVATVLQHIQSQEQLTFARYADVQMRHWHDARVVCIGDCAHATSPQLGQGANLALVDAMTLAACFAEAPVVEQALALYSQRRRTHLRYYQGASKLLTPFFQSDSRIASTLRDIALGPLCGMPIARQQMAMTLSGSKTGWLFGKLRQPK